MNVYLKEGHGGGFAILVGEEKEGEAEKLYFYCSSHRNHY